jgi:hypothetical protein
MNLQETTKKPVRMVRVPADIQKMYLSNKVDALLPESTCSLTLKVFILTTLITVQFTATATDLSLVQNIETSSETHPNSYSGGTEGSFLGGKIARA